MSAAFLLLVSCAHGLALYAVSDAEFGRMTAAAIASGRVLDLGQQQVVLETPYSLRQSSVLRISGGRICGSGHSIFQVGGNRKGLLELRNVELVHHSSHERSEKRSLGAALFVRGKGRLALHGCTISSEAGFGLWLVQKAQAVAESCKFRRCGRSTVVCFEESSLQIDKTELADASCHAICARGSTRVVVRHSRIERAELRSIFCYHSSYLEVTSCHISGNRSEGAPAIQIDALRPQDAGQLKLSDSMFVDNAGGDLSVAGNVERHIERCGALIERAPDTVVQALPQR